MNIRICIYLFLVSLVTACGTKRMGHQARANIHLPVQPVELSKEKAKDKKLPSVIDMKDALGNKTTYVRTQNDQLSVQLGEVTVTAKMKNVVERFGKVDVDFIVSIPEELINSRWQLNLTPHLIKADSISDFEDLVISGDEFRKLQQKQYAKFNEYLSKIVPDSLFDQHFLKSQPFHRYIDKYNKTELNRVHKDSMDHVGYLKHKTKLNKRYDYFNQKMYRNRSWLEKNLSSLRVNQRYDQLVNIFPMFHLLRDFTPEFILWKYRKEKYTKGFTNNYLPVTAADSVFLKTRFFKNRQIARNQKRIDNKDIVFAQMVRFAKNDKARLDTVIYNKGKFEYYYRQQVMADEDSRRMKVYLDGFAQSVREEKHLLPNSDTLSYTVSSMIQFLDTMPRYLRKVIERKAMSSLRANVTFHTGKYDMDIELGDNRSELDKVQTMLDKLTQTGEFVMDSISLIAGCSPEGSFRSNMLLSKRRAESIQKYLVSELSDIEGIDKMLKAYPKGEDWGNLSRLVQDSLTGTNKQSILELIAANIDPDQKELDIRSKYPIDYKYMREQLYPQLRAVDFTFHVHRAGMIKDTIHTTELDTIYARSIDLMVKRKYADALQILHEYNDYNTAICLMSLGYDQAAYTILVREDETANSEYLLAILASRLDRTEEAVVRYLHSVELDPSKRWRGRLDPEIHKLIQAYSLNKVDDE